jgi:hypothetical protein
MLENGAAGSSMTGLSSPALGAALRAVSERPFFGACHRFLRPALAEEPVLKRSWLIDPVSAGDTRGKGHPNAIEQAGTSEIAELRLTCHSEMPGAAKLPYHVRRSPWIAASASNPRFSLPKLTPDRWSRQIRGLGVPREHASGVATRLSSCGQIGRGRDILMVAPRRNFVVARGHQ